MIICISLCVCFGVEDWLCVLRLCPHWYVFAGIIISVSENAYHMTIYVHYAWALSYLLLLVLEPVPADTGKKARTPLCYHKANTQRDKTNNSHSKHTICRFGTTMLAMLADLWTEEEARVPGEKSRRHRENMQILLRKASISDDAAVHGWSHLLV